MKVRALILFFPFAIFLAEMNVFPSEVNKSCGKTETNSCQKMSCKMARMPMKCAGKKDNNQKQGKCNNNPDCTFCPVCSVFTFQPQYEWSAKYLFLKKNYPRVNTRFISSYISAAWKPPDGHPYS